VFRHTGATMVDLIMERLKMLPAIKAAENQCNLIKG
jgi:hypothetical protein